MYEEDAAPKRMTRRELLRTAGLFAGALVTTPILSLPQPAGARSIDTAAPRGRAKARLQLLKIGVLLPKSSIYPALGANFLAGMQLLLSQSAREGEAEVTLLPVDVGFGPALARQSVAGLKKEGVDLIFAVLNPSAAAALRDLLEGPDGTGYPQHAEGARRSHEATRPTPLIAGSLGENVPRESQRSPFIFHHSLAAWQANWALGNWAAGKLGRRAFVATSLYDSGYDSIYAFRLGFEGGGGAVQQTCVTHAFDGTGAGTAIERIAEARPDLVFGAYCGSQAVEFVKAYAGSGLSARIPLIGSAFLADESILPAHGSAALGIKTAPPWAAALAGREGAEFVTAYRSQTGRSPDAFALLGYEAAGLALDALASTGDSRQVDSLRAALSTARFTGPRGPVAMDGQEQAAAPFYLLEVQERGGTLRNVIAGSLDAAPARDRRIEELRASLKTGWLNAYLSV